jgi:hypothetical protein
LTFVFATLGGATRTEPGATLIIELLLALKKTCLMLTGYLIHSPDNKIRPEKLKSILKAPKKLVILKNSIKCIEFFHL